MGDEDGDELMMELPEMGSVEDTRHIGRVQSVLGAEADSDIKNYDNEDKRIFSEADVAAANAILFAVRAPQTYDSPQWVPLDDVIGRISVILEFFDKHVFKDFMDIRNDKAKQKSREKKQNDATRFQHNLRKDPEHLPFFQAIHLEENETRTDFSETKKLDAHENYPNVKGFECKLEERWEQIINESDVNKWHLLEMILESRASIHKTAQEAFCQAMNVIFTFDTQLLKDTRQNINYWRIYEGEVCDNLTFINFVDNVICFLVFEQEYPELFAERISEPDKGFKENEPSFVKALGKPLSAVEEEDDDIDNNGEDFQKEASFPVYGLLFVTLIMSSVSAMIVFWKIKSNALLISNVGNVCQVTNQRIEARISSLKDNVFASSSIILRHLQDGRLNLTKTFLDEDFSIDSYLFDMMTIYHLRGIFIGDRYGQYTYTGLLADNTKFVIGTNDSSARCLVMYGVMNTDNVRNTSDGKNTIICKETSTIISWLPSYMNRTDQWSDLYLLPNKEYGSSYISFDQYTNGSEIVVGNYVGLDISLRDLNDFVFDDFTLLYSGAIYAVKADNNQLVGSNEEDSAIYDEVTYPSNSTVEEIRIISTLFENEYDISSSNISESTHYGPKELGSYLICGSYDNRISFPALFVTGFSRDDYAGSFDAIFQSSTSIAVLSCIVSLVTVVITSFLLKKRIRTLAAQNVTAVYTSNTEAVEMDKVDEDPPRSSNVPTSAHAQEQQERQMKETENAEYEKHRKSAKGCSVRPLFYAILFIFSLLVIIWGSWTGYASSQIRISSEKLSHEAALTISLEAENFISTAILVAQAILLLHKDQSKSLPSGTDMGSILQRERTLSAIVNSFDSSIVHGCVVAYESGQMTSVWNNKSVIPYGLILKTVDNEYGKNYSWYSTTAEGQRNHSDLIFRSNSVLRVTEKVWYHNAANWKTILTGSPEILDDGNLGLTLSFPLVDSSNGTIIGAGAVIVKLGYLSSYLAAANFYADSEIHVWVMLSNGTVVASSTLEESQVLGGARYPMTGLDSQNKIVSSTTQFLKNYYGGEDDYLSQIGSLKKVDRPLDSPYTLVNSIIKEEYNLSWCYVLTYDKEALYGVIEDRIDFTLLILIFTIILIIYIVNLSITHIRNVAPNVKLIDLMAGEDLDSEIAAVWYRRVFPIVLKAFAMMWRRDSSLANRPISLDLLNEKRLENARERFFDARSGNDIAVVCFMEAQSTWIFKLWVWNTSLYNRLLVRFFLSLHFVVAFLEHASQKQLTELKHSRSAGVLECFCLVVEFQDAITRTILLVKAMKVKYPIDDLKRKLQFIITLDFALILIFLDLILKWRLSFSFQFYIPLKVIVVILEVEEVRNMLTTFLMTTARAKEVWILYSTLIVVASTMGHILFRTTVNVDSEQNSWKNSIRSFITAFIFISTSDNYDDCVYSAKSVSGFYMVYFVVFTVLGRLFIIALVLSFFQDSFTDTLREALLKLRKKDRLGLIGSFILIDVNTSGTVDKDEFRNFVQHINTHAKTDRVDRIFDELDKERSDDSEKGVLSIKEFVVGVERSSQVKIDNEDFEIVDPDEKQEAYSSENPRLTLGDVLSPLVSLSERLRWKLYPIVSSPSFDTFVLCCIILQMGILSLYGTWSNYVVLDYFNSILVMINTLDVIVKVFVYRRAYFFWSHYNFRRSTDVYITGENSQEFANRADFFVVLLSFLLFLGSRTVAGGFSFDETEDSLRFAMTFPVLRLFTQVKSSLVLLYTLGVILPQFASLFVLLFLFFFTFAVYGVLLFQNQFPSLLQDSAPNGNFDSLSESFLCLFQLFTGQGWSDILYAGVRVNESYAVSIYFISYIILVTMLFVNVVTALILTVSQRIIGMKNVSADEINESLLKD